MVILVVEGREVSGALDVEFDDREILVQAVGKNPGCVPDSVDSSSCHLPPNAAALMIHRDVHGSQRPRGVRASGTCAHSEAVFV
jgi:hypothetical protein